MGVDSLFPKRKRKKMCDGFESFQSNQDIHLFKDNMMECIMHNI